MEIRIFAQAFESKLYVTVDNRLNFYISSKLFTIKHELYVKDAQTEEVLATLVRKSSFFTSNYIVLYSDDSWGNFTSAADNTGCLRVGDDVFEIKSKFHFFKPDSYTITHNSKQVGASNKMNLSLFNSDMYSFNLNNDCEVLNVIVLMALYNDINRE